MKPDMEEDSVTPRKGNLGNLDIWNPVKNIEMVDEPMDLTMENGRLPILGMFCTGVVLLVSAINIAEGMTDPMRAYSKAHASVTMILSFILLARIKQLEAASIYVKYFLFVWNFVGSCVLTFGEGPFSQTGNGYFFAWAMSIFSFMALGITYDAVKKTLVEHATPLTGLGFCAFVVVLAVIPFINSEYKWESIFALVVALLTIVIVLNFIYKFQRTSELPEVAFQILLLLAVLWGFTAGITTFRGPFLLTGNGYFASWGGTIIGVVAAKDAYKEDDDEEEEQADEEVAAAAPSSPSREDMRSFDGTASRTAMDTILENNTTV